MRARAVGVVAALIGGVGWLAKILVMAVQGGPDPDSIPEAIAFFAGLVGVLVAAAAAGAFLARRSPTLLRALAAAGMALAAIAVVGVGQAALTALPGEGWLQEEAIFGLVGLAAVVVALLALVGRGLRVEAGRSPS